MDNGIQSDLILSSWKEIAAFFGKGVRTVQRWERQFNLPVRRPFGSDKKIVLARTAELERWMGQQTSPAEPLAVQQAFERVQHMRTLVLNMQKQTERLQSNTARFVDHYARISGRKQQRSGRKAS
jgi:transposase